MALLNVNIDHVATLRQARHADEPDPVWASVQCELAGANGITAHLRQDRRHINDRDALMLRHATSSKFNLEMSMASQIVQLAEHIQPDQVTLVPENRQELTTEGGLDCVANKRRLAEVVRRMHRLGILVSAFITPDIDQVMAAVKTGCDAVELHTGQYANARGDKAVHRQIDRLEQARDAGLSRNLTVHAGHGLTYRNIGLVAAIEGLCEFNIGHSIVSRAVIVGMREATAQMIALIDKYSRRAG